MNIQREEYVERLVKLKDNGRVKIITGIRRCGKSYLLRVLYKEHLLKTGIGDDQFLVLALDDYANNSLLNPLELDRYIREITANKSQRFYIVIDEIQNVFNIKNPVFTGGKIVKATKDDTDIIGYVQIVLGLMQLANVDLYITGSNSRFLSRDIITDFRDRGDEIHVQPLTFKEFCSTQDGNYEALYEEYALHGGMPRTLEFKEGTDKEKYLYDLYQLTYIKDILDRHNHNFHQELDALTGVMASNIGSLVNPNTIANTYKTSMKVNLSKQTIYSYLEELENAYILHKVERYDIRGRKHIGALYKYYFSDLGLRNARLQFMHQDRGHVMENIIYNELIHRGYNVEIGVIEVFSKDSKGKTIRTNYETDFIAKKGSKCYYIQSAYEITSEDKYLQESKPLSLINDFFKKVIITRSPGPIRHDDKGITTIGIIDFLLDNDSLDK